MAKAQRAKGMSRKVRSNVLPGDNSRRNAGGVRTNHATSSLGAKAIAALREEAAQRAARQWGFLDDEARQFLKDIRGDDGHPEIDNMISDPQGNDGNVESGWEDEPSSDDVVSAALRDIIFARESGRFTQDHIRTWKERRIYEMANWDAVLEPLVLRA
ncbi:hypothetical protein K474DRAFT_1745861 [Panus rudis PR-1116 ss-1]|nr:hypothetical protein K474DRAFT_1745861 [Panus rudis PR-1116 ss-1]